LTAAIAPGAPATLLDALAEAISRAGRHNPGDQVAPAAILWPDEAREWEPILPLLEERLPLLTLGPYEPARQTGPAIWIRCALAGTIGRKQGQPEGIPVVYLPGVGPSGLRPDDDCPDGLRPLAELQYRGSAWVGKRGRSWTVASFLEISDGGLGIRVGADAETRKAMRGALTKLVREPLERLRVSAPLRAQFFNALLSPDEVGTLLHWLDDPAGCRRELDAAEWEAFSKVIEQKYGCSPERDGPISVARLLGRRGGPWAVVWQRFAEAPQVYPRVAEVLRQACPSGQLPLFEARDAWPQVNSEDEGLLRKALVALPPLSPPEARARIADLEAEHGPRRSWVWAKLGLTPLANSLEALARLARLVERPLVGASVDEYATAYADWGHRVDAAFMDALGCVTAAQDAPAVKTAGEWLYRDWVEAAAEGFAKLVGAAAAGGGYRPSPGLEAEPGTILLYTDALRFDVGAKLTQALRQAGLHVELTWSLAALPTVTATSKPAETPLAELLTGGTGLEPSLSASGPPLSADGFRRLLAGRGYQVLAEDETGNPKERAWTELGSIDSYAHQNGWRLAHVLPAEIARLLERVQGLLDAGWETVVVVTDHGWLLLPSGLPKVHLPEHLTELRKGRCARLRAGQDTEFQTVPWHWDPAVRIALAPGISCFEAGKEYEHGGLSPQECVVPLLKVTRDGGGQGGPLRMGELSWRGLRCSVTIEAARPGLMVDLRTKPGDPGSSIVTEARPPDSAGMISLLVPDDRLAGAAAVLVVFGADGTVLAQEFTTVGG